MRWTIAYSKIKKRNLLLINNEQPIRQPLKGDANPLTYSITSDVKK